MTTQYVYEILKGLKLDLTKSFESGENVMIRCPFAKVSGHKHKVDSHPSFGIRLAEDGLKANCFTCGRRFNSLWSFVNRLKIEDVLDEDVNIFKVINSVKLPKHLEHTKVKNTEWKRKGEEKFSKKFWMYHIKKRKVHPKIVQKFLLRYDKKDDSVIFPLYDIEAEYKGYVEHSLRPDAKFKYVNHGDVEDLLYGEVFIKGKIIILVEGMYDVLRIYQYLFILDLLKKYSVVGTFGSNVTQAQLERIDNFANALLLFYDNDNAGRKAERKIYNELKKKRPIIFKLHYTKKDPAQLSLREFEEVIKTPRFYK